MFDILKFYYKNSLQRQQFVERELAELSEHIRIPPLVMTFDDASFWSGYKIVATEESLLCH